ncbi:MAG: SAM-dependent methyltransferase [Clostridia bacterium]|nr:SAM-dependent methyltransferase [Clostridia bacterium]
MAHNENILKICELILKSASKNRLKKAILSKPIDKTIQKSVLSPKIISGKAALQNETFHKDNKATHKNFFIDTLSPAALADVVNEYMQINLICDGAECEYKCSVSGKTVLLGEKKLERLLDAANTSQSSCNISENNKKKKYILSGSEPFLRELEVADENGRVYDKKQAKFRQINRFLEIIRDAEDKLPSDCIRICDLCCGKSYLSFAAYHYFANVKGMKVSMTGVDLKPDVVERCNAVASALGFDGLEFICMDVNDYNPSVLPSLVISLHACDIATDIVLCKAAEWHTDVILATPCCHHELNHNINCKELSFITEHSMLRQKLCDAATDALRLCRLEAEGYTTSTVELIDPNDTPKNVMLRAFRKKGFRKDSDEAKAALARYLAAKQFLCGSNDTSSFHF